MNGEVVITEPGQIDAPADRIRHLVLAGQDLFSRRANRFRQLAPGHPLESYFNFLALLADAQQEALNQFPEVPQPDQDKQAFCRKQGMPLLDTGTWTRDLAWRKGLTMVLQQLENAVLPTVASETIAGLLRASETGLERMADVILAGKFAEISPQELPFIAAALQVYWLQMATTLGESTFGRLEHGGVCPVCGSFPGSGIVNSAKSGQGLRYLCCSLCASGWHMVRIKCSGCESTQSINHYTLEGSNGAVKAESCDDCNSYLKLLYLEKDLLMDALADDLATLPLDILMAEEGKSRRGPNLFFHPGVRTVCSTTSLL